MATETASVASPTSSSSPSIPPLPKGRAKACTNCRQVKLKCNARETWPRPCFRCKSQGTDCRMDSAFRRVPARRQLEEVSQKLNNLQRLLDSNQGTNSSLNEASRYIPDPSATHRTVDGSSINVGSEHAKRIGKSDGLAAQLPLPDWSQPVSKPIPPFPTQSGFLNLIDEDKSSSWSLGGVTVTYNVAKALFSHFNDHKWHHIPVLQHCTRLQDLYNASDLLFWTILLQAARNHGLYGSYYLDLLPHHRLLLGASLLGQYNIHTLHAILLICTWPYPNPRQTPEEASAKVLRNRDPSWMLLGAAVNMGTMMGLHKPGRQEEFGYDARDDYGSGSDFHVRNVTWLYIFQLSTSQSSWLGVTPPLSSPGHMDTMATLCQDESIPEWMRAKADIQRRVAQFTMQLDTTLDLRTRSSLIRMFEQYLDRAKDEFAGSWSQGLEIDYQGAKLYLYGIAFVNSPRGLGYKPIEDPGIMARNILQRGLTAAVQLCHTACNMNFQELPVPESQPQLSSYTYQLSWFPKRFNLAIAFATIFLAWFLAVDKEALTSDRLLARKHMDDVRQLYATFHHSQEHLNIGRKLANLTTTPVTAPKLTVSSRLGASFMYSYNFMYRYVKSTTNNHEQQQEDSSSVSQPLAKDPTSQSNNNNDGLDQTAPENHSNSNLSTLSESWDMPWSEWDPAVFEELQNLTWDTAPWEMPLVNGPGGY